MPPGKANEASAAVGDRIDALPDELFHRILSFLPAQQIFGSVQQPIPQFSESIFWKVHKISSQSLKHLKIYQSSFSNSSRTRIHAPSLVSLHLQVFIGRTPVLDTVPLLLGAVVELSSSCADTCCIDEYGDCCDETCKDCILHQGSCVLLQGLSQAKNLCLISHFETHIFRRDMKCGPTFELLKKFVLDEHWCVPDVSALASILQHAPVLEDLCLLLFSKVLVSRKRSDLEMSILPHISLPVDQIPSAETLKDYI